jgi:hypothetical protein
MGKLHLQKMILTSYSWYEQTLMYSAPQIGERPYDWNDNIKFKTVTYQDGSAYVATKGRVIHRVAPPNPPDDNQKKWYLAGQFDEVYYGEDNPSRMIEAASKSELYRYIYDMIRYIHGPSTLWYKIYRMKRKKKEEKEAKKDTEDTEDSSEVSELELMGCFWTDHEATLVEEISNTEDFDYGLHDARFRDEEFDRSGPESSAEESE